MRCFSPSGRSRWKIFYTLIRNRIFFYARRLDCGTGRDGGGEGEEFKSPTSRRPENFFSTILLKIRDLQYIKFSDLCRARACVCVRCARRGPPVGMRWRVRARARLPVADNRENAFGARFLASSTYTYYGGRARSFPAVKKEKKKARPISLSDTRHLFLSPFFRFPLFLQVFSSFFHRARLW